MGREGQLPLSHGGVEGGPPPSRDYDSFFSLCSSGTCKIGLNCSEMLLPANCGISLPLRTHPTFKLSYGFV